MRYSLDQKLATRINPKRSLHWRSPAEGKRGEEWRIDLTDDFTQDVLFTRLSDQMEAFTIGKYILKLVREELPRHSDHRTKEIVLFARDVRGKAGRLPVPFELLLYVVSKGYIAPNLIAWFQGLPEEVLCGFLRIADEQRKGRKLSAKIFLRCEEDIKQALGRISYKKHRRSRKRAESDKNT